MSLVDKVIKNTFYNFLSQMAGYLFPFILIPFIIGKIGQVEFGIYAIAYGFIGAFTLFDLGVSTSFVKFVSEYYYKKDFESLNSIINIGVAFYFVFTVLFWILGYIFSEYIINYINIPPEAYAKGKFSLHISLFIFFVATNSNMFVSILISLQKMYVNSLLNIFTGIFNFVSIIIVLMMGYGIYGLLYCQLATVFTGTVINIILAKKYLPQMALGFGYMKISFLKKMTNFGLQMQVSKLAGFFSEKYDEFLLSIFSLMNSVTFFNLSTRIMRFAKIIPMQFVVQIAPVAAELQSKNEKEKLNILFEDTLKYLSLVSIPISVFFFLFSDEIILTWMGAGYEITSYILKVLIVGMLINLILSAPGNSILPNIGIPKYQMYEGLIYLTFNIIISYILIKSYGIVGAAYGNVIATVIAASYVFIVSVKYFKESYFRIIGKVLLPPLLLSIFLGTVIFILYEIFSGLGFSVNSRIGGVVFLTAVSVLFLLSYLFVILDTNYLTERNKITFAKLVLKVIPIGKFKKKESGIKEYSGELVSLVIVTYNKKEALKLCLNSLLKTINELNYELLIWNNNSEDDTKQYLENELPKSNRIKIINNKINIGNNAKSKAVQLAKGEFIIGIDDDVIEFSENWVYNMIRAYKSVPYMGYLVTDVFQDEKTNGAKFPESTYVNKNYYNGEIIIQLGPAGGWCFMISRKVYSEIGKLLTIKNRKFIFEDGDYQLRVNNTGLMSGILKNTRVYHATGEYYNEVFGNPLLTKYTEAKKPLPVSYKIIRKLKISLNIVKRLKALYRFFVTKNLI